MNDVPSPNPGLKPATHSLRRSAIRGGVWTTGGFAVSQVLRLGGNIVLAALLYEEAFALMAIVLAFMQGLLMFSDFGLSPSIIQNRRGDDPDFLNTAWTLQVIRGAGIAAVTAALSWPLAAFYAANDPVALELRYLLPIAAIGPLLTGLQSVNLMRSQRHLQLGRNVAIEVLSQAIGLATMIAGAWLYKSVYALVVGNILTAAVKTLLSHVVMQGPRGRFRFDKVAALEIIRFGRWIFLSTMITFLAMQLDKLAFGKMFPFEEVGVYGIAAGIALLTPTLIGRLQGMVAFPLYSRILESKRDLGPLVERTKYAMFVLGGYIVALMIATSPAFIQLAYDQRYVAAAIYIPILSAGAWFAVVHGLYGSVLLALGKAGIVAMTNTVKVLAFCVMLIPAARMGGILGAVIAVALSDFIRAIFAMVYVRRHGMRSQKLDAQYTFYVFGIGAVLLFLTEGVNYLESWHPAIRMAVQFILVSVAFLPALLRVVTELRRPERSAEQLPT